MFATPSLSEKPPDTPVPQWLEPCVVAQKQTIGSHWPSQKLLLSHWLAWTGNGRCALGQVWHMRLFSQGILGRSWETHLLRLQRHLYIS